jgi:hypothetical protein
MMDRGGKRDFRPVPGFFYGLAAALATVLIVGLAALVNPQPAGATRAFARQTGLACGRCHVNPAGGGSRTAFGNAFAASGNKMPSTAKLGKPSAPGGASPSSPPAATPSSPAASSTSIVLDYAQAQAWSLRHPYYSHFLYSPDDYRN